MNIDDLIKSLGYLSIPIFVTLAIISVKGGRVVRQTMNPNRKLLLWSAPVFMSSAVSWLLYEANLSGVPWHKLLIGMLTSAPSPPYVMRAVALFMVGLVCLLLAVWCLTQYPRDPSTFHRVGRDLNANIRRAVDYYVSSSFGGLDFACVVDSLGIATYSANNPKRILHQLPLLKRIEMTHKAEEDIPAPPEKESESERRKRIIQEQVDAWTALATSLYDKGVPELDAVVFPGRQGHLKRVVLDPYIGGIFFGYLQQEWQPSGKQHTIYVFAATLDQAKMNCGQAPESFNALIETLRGITVDYFRE